MRKHRVGMAVAPCRKHPTPVHVHNVKARPIGDARKFRHGTKVRHTTIVNRYPRIVHHRELGHGRTGHLPWDFVEGTHKAFDVLEQRAHDVQGIPSQGWLGIHLATCSD